MLIAFARIAVVGLALVFAGCSNTTSRVSDELTTSAQLVQDKKGIALIKLGAADPSCVTLLAGIGVREGDAFKRVQTVKIVIKPNEPSVAEIAIDAGQYHVVSYACLRLKGAPAVMATPTGDSGMFAKSYASFDVQPGEVVNVGFLRLVSLGASQAPFSRVVRVAVVASDWPVAELDRFKQHRPALYEQMKTRLMTVPKVEPLTADQVAVKCAELKKLQAEGKIQNLPAACVAPSQPPQQKKVPGKADVRA